MVSCKSPAAAGQPGGGRAAPGSGVHAAAGGRRRGSEAAVLSSDHSEGKYNLFTAGRNLIHPEIATIPESYGFSNFMYVFFRTLQYWRRRESGQ